MDSTDKKEMIDRLISDHDINFNNGDEELLSGFIDMYLSIACDNSNREKTDVRLYPYVYNAVKMAYLRRGREGSSSTSEGSISNSFIDIEEKLAKDVRTIRLPL